MLFACISQVLKYQVLLTPLSSHCGVIQYATAKKYYDLSKDLFLLNFLSLLFKVLYYTFIDIPEILIAFLSSSKCKLLSYLYLRIYLPIILLNP